MSTARVITVLLALVGVVLALVFVWPGISSATDEAAATITAAEMQEHIGFLAGDRLRGRDTPSPELDTVADYVVRAFRSLGLEPGAGAGEFVQRYRFPTVELDRERTRLELRYRDSTMVLELGRDFAASPGAGEAGRTQLVFVDGDAASEVRPGSFDGLAFLALYDDPPLRRLREAARISGAEAAVVVMSGAGDRDRVYHSTRILGQARRVVGGVRSPPVFLVRRDVVQEALCATRTGLEGCLPHRWGVIPLLEIRAARAPVRVVEDDAPAPNVVAVLPGSDPELRDSYVVVSAHMDHFGIGEADAHGDSIYNGADDDASGVAALLEVAEAFAGLPTAPPRSIVFIAFSGTEKELVGSQWFVDHPTVPLDRVVGSLNVDMIGRNAPGEVFAIGREFSTLGPLVEEVAGRHRELGLTVPGDAPTEEMVLDDRRLFFSSDQLSLVLREIPSVLISTGLHDDYHQASDEAAAIDADKVTRVARLVFHAVHAVASAEGPPQWTEEGRALIATLTSPGSD